jgi:hypothetical protein
MALENRYLNKYTANVTVRDSESTNTEILDERLIKKG